MHIWTDVFTYLVSLSDEPEELTFVVSNASLRTEKQLFCHAEDVMRVQCSSANTRGHCGTYAPLSTCTELHLSGKFLSLILGQSEVRSSRLPAKFRCSKRVTWEQGNLGKDPVSQTAFASLYKCSNATSLRRLSAWGLWHSQHFSIELCYYQWLIIII